MASAALRRSGGWALAVAGASALLLASEAATAAGVGGLRASRDLVRLLLAVPLAVAALVSRRAGARAEAVAFGVLAACLALAAVADAATVGWLAADAPGGAAERVRRGLVARVAWPFVVFGVPAAAGVLALRIALADVWLGTRPAGRATAAAAVLGLLAFPIVNAANVFGNAAVRLASLSRDAASAGWPPLAAAVDRPLFPPSAGDRMLDVALRLALAFPLLEACLHGVARQGLARLGAVPFVVATAFVAAAASMDAQMPFGLFLGALATGLFAARTGSLLPAIAFWPALFLSQSIWLSAVDAARAP